MMIYPSPLLATRNSAIITPTRHNPILTFIQLMIIGMLPGKMSLVNISILLPPRVVISFTFSGGVSAKLVYNERIVPKIEMEMAVTRIVLYPVPSHTIRTGARADFGKLFNVTR